MIRAVLLCSIRIALIWAQKSIVLYFLNKNKAKDANSVGVPCV